MIAARARRAVSASAGVSAVLRRSVSTRLYSPVRVMSGCSAWGCSPPGFGRGWGWVLPKVGLEARRTHPRPLPETGGEGSRKCGPFGAEGFHDRRFDKAFDIGARGVVGAELGAFVRGQRLFEQGVEDRRFDLTPFFGGGIVQFADRVDTEIVDLAILEQATVEVANRAAQRQAVTLATASVHQPPDFLKPQFKALFVRWHVSRRPGRREATGQEFLEQIFS